MLVPHVRARASTTMALLENFKREDAQYAGCKLPDPQGALAKEVPPSAASDFTAATAKGSRRLSGSLAHKFLADQCIPTRPEPLNLPIILF